MKGECDICELNRNLEGFDMSHRNITKILHMCKSCADVVGIQELIMTPQGKLLLKINAKLDTLLARKKK